MIVNMIIKECQSHTVFTTMPNKELTWYKTQAICHNEKHRNYNWQKEHEGRIWKKKNIQAIFDNEGYIIYIWPWRLYKIYLTKNNIWAIFDTEENIMIKFHNDKAKKCVFLCRQKRHLNFFFFNLSGPWLRLKGRRSNPECTNGLQSLTLAWTSGPMTSETKWTNGPRILMEKNE